MAREWEPPTRVAWNDLIKECLRAIDRHGDVYRHTGDGHHARLAHQLRCYVAGLKDSIVALEASMASGEGCCHQLPAARPGSALGGASAAGVDWSPCPSAAPRPADPPGSR